MERHHVVDIRRHHIAIRLIAQDLGQSLPDLGEASVRKREPEKFLFLHHSADLHHVLHAWPVRSETEAQGQPGHPDFVRLASLVGIAAFA